MGNGRLTISDIVITSPISYTSVLSFEMTGEEGQHGYANVILEVDESLEASRVGGIQGSNADISLKDGTVLLKGICKSAGMSSQGGYNTVQLTIVTMSYKADEQKANLVFQDPGKKLSDMVNKVMTPCGIKVSYEKDLPISHVVYQQNETPWQFVKRLAAQYGKSVYVDFRQAEISIGTVGFQTYGEEILEEFESEGKNIDELRLVQSNQDSLAASYGFANQSYRTRTLDAGVGDRCGKEIIVASHLVSEGGILVNHISVKKSKNAAPSQAQQSGPSFYSGIMSGSVTAVDGNQIQVKFTAHGNLGGGSTWVPYESAISNSFYCMPDIGDEVFIYYENNGKIVCLGSKRAGGSHADYNKPDEKALTSYDKMIKFTQTGLNITATRELLDAQSEQAISIKMDDKEGIVIESGKSVVIDAGENLLMKAGKKTVKQNTELLKKGKEKFAAREQAGADEYAADSGMSAGEQFGKSILTGLSSFGSDVADSFIEGVQGMVFYDIWGGKSDAKEEAEEDEEIFETGVLSLYGLEGLILNVGESTICLGTEVNFSTPDFRWLGYEQGEHAKEELPLKDWWETALDGLQLVLDIAGFIPGVGDVLDIVNAGISLARGDYFGAACSLVSAIPGVGSFIGGGAKALKTVSKVTKVISKLENVIKYAKYFYAALEFGATLYRNKDAAVELFNLIKDGKFDFTNCEHVDLLIAMGNVAVAGVNFGKDTADTFGKKKSDGPDSNKGDDDSSDSNNKDNDDTSDSNKKDNDTSDSKNKETTQGNGDGADKQTCKYDPINVVTGSQTLVYTDIEIEDITGSVYFKRTYESIYTDEKGLFGNKWMAFLETNITQKDGLTVVQMPDMSLIQYKKTDFGYENVRKGDGAYRLFDTNEGYLLTSVREADSYYYHPNGQLAYIEDRNHNRTTLIYNGTLLEKVVYASGQYLEFFYTGKHVSSIRDILGRETKYEYDGELLTTVIMANGGKICYDYTSEGYLHRITDQNGRNYVTNYYDRRGRVVRQEMSSGDEFVMFYDDAARENTFVTTANGNKVVYAYGREKLPTKVTYADGTFELTKYDEQHNIIYQRDRNGGETYRTYNDSCLLLTEKLPTGLETHYTYNEQNLIASIKDNAGWEENRIYDENGNLLTKIRRIDDTTRQKVSFTYDSHGRMLTATDPRGNVTRYSYDTDFSFISEKEAPEGIHVSYTYDKAGRNMSVEHEFGSRHYGYNQLNMITLEEDEEGGVTKTLYDSLGNVVCVSTPNLSAKNGSVQAGTRYEYDDMDNLIRTIRPSGKVMAYLKDVEGNVLKEINPNTYDPVSKDGEGIRHEYDPDGNRIKTLYPDGGVERFFYDGNGNLIRRIAPQEYAEHGEKGAGYVFAYDAGNRLSRVTNPDGMVERAFVYDLAGNLIKEMDAKGYTYGEEDASRIGTLYTYNTIGWLTQKRVPMQEEDGEIRYQLTTYRYDVSGNCIEEKRYLDYQSKTSAKGIVHTIQYTYDGADRLTGVNDCTGAVITYAYDSMNRRTMERYKLSDNLYGEKHFTYSPSGRLIKVMERADEAGCGKKYAKTIYEYDKNGNPTRIITPLGNEIIRHYNEDDELVCEEHKEADGTIDNRTKFAYDNAGNILSVTDVNGVSIQYRYDLLNRQISHKNKNGGITWKQYDRDGRIIKEILPNAYAKNAETAKGYGYTYDRLGREVCFYAPDGSLIYEKSYNAYGELKGQRDAQGGGIEYAYDLGGRRILARTAGNSRQTYAYDAFGRVINTTDGNGNAITYELDMWGRITGITMADDTREYYAYDHAGNMISATDGEGHTVSYAYNALSLMSSRTDAAGETETFLYDAEGRLTEHTDRNGNRTTYRHNMYSALTLRENKENGLQEIFGYEKDGKLSYAIGGGMRYDYEYHPDGSLKAKKASGRTLLSYEYDLNGNKTAQTDLTGKRSEYVYNELDLLTQVRDNGKSVATYSYGEDGTIRELCVGGILTTSYEYDLDKNVVAQKTIMAGRSAEEMVGRSTGEMISEPAVGTTTAQSQLTGLNSSWTTRGTKNLMSGSGAINAQLLVDNHYGYDGNGNRIFKHTLSGHTSYTYDSVNRLVEAAYPTYKENFYYDRAGNRTQRITEAMQELYSYDVCNRLTEQTTIENTKDGLAGNETKTYYRYDKQGNMVSAVRESGNLAGNQAGLGSANESGNKNEKRQETCKFYYDNFNRQVKTETFDGQVQVNRYDAERLRHELEENGRLVQFLFSGREVVAETKEDASTIRYLRGHEIISSDSESARTYYHYVNDENGSVTHVVGEDDETSSEQQTERANGTKYQVLNRYEYDAFGKYILCEEKVANRLGYTGQQYDQVTGQYYLRARFYNPVIGRFIQEDTYYGDGLNLYAYCKNLPVGYADPSGHYPCQEKLDLYKKYREQGLSKKDADLKSNYDLIRKNQGKKAAEKYIKNEKLKQQLIDSGMTPKQASDYIKQKEQSGKSFSEKWNDYIADIQKQTGRKISKEQLQKLMKEVCKYPHKNKLTGDMYDYHRYKEWPDNKESLIAEWERQTGQNWPVYGPNDAKISGNGNRKNGRKYDAHEIIPNVYDSPMEWWNIFPAANGSEHQGGIHGSGAPFYDIFPK